MANQLQRFIQRGQRNAPNFDFGGGSSGQSPQEAFTINVARQKAKEPFRRAKERRQEQRSIRKEQRKAERPLSATQAGKKEFVGVQQQIENVKNLREIAQGLPAGRVEGGLASLQAFITGGEGEASEVKLYNDLRPAFAAGLYRDLTGDKRLSDRDASARALPLIWSTTESEDVRDLKFDFLETALQIRKNLVEKGEIPEEITENDPEGLGQSVLNRVISETAKQVQDEEGAEQITDQTQTISGDTETAGQKGQTENLEEQIFERLKNKF